MKISFPKFNTGLIILPKDKLGRTIKENDLVVKQNPITGLNELWWISFHHQGEWYASKVMDELYMFDTEEEYLPLGGRLFTTRTTRVIQGLGESYLLDGVVGKIETEEDCKRELIENDDDKIWYYDRLGRFPVLGDIVLFQEPSENGSTILNRLGIISFDNPKTGKKYLTRLVMPKNKKGLGNLKLVGSQVDLSYIRGRYGIIILDRNTSRRVMVSGSMR